MPERKPLDVCNPYHDRADILIFKSERLLCRTILSYLECSMCYHCLRVFCWHNHEIILYIVYLLACFWIKKFYIKCCRSFRIYGGWTPRHLYFVCATICQFFHGFGGCCRCRCR